MKHPSAASSPSPGSREGGERREEALRWAALDKLPTFYRLRTAVLKSYQETDNSKNQLANKEVDVRKLDAVEQQRFVERVFEVPVEDNEKFLRKFRKRVDK